MSRLRIALIGAGHLGRIHARLISSIDSSQLVAIADPCPTALNAISEFVADDVIRVADYRHLVGQIDAAIIATPTRFHFGIAADLLQSGIHLLIEKPLTDSVGDAEAIVDMADRHNCVVAVGHCEQFNAAIRAALGEIGDPKFIQASRLSGYTFRSTDIGVVHDLMIHDIDLVNSMFGGQVVDTRATGISIFGNHEDIAQARLQFSCGGVANLTASRCSFSPQRSIQIFGTNGFAQVNLATHHVEVVRVPSWIRKREHDFDSTSAAGQEFIKEKLFTRLLPKQQYDVEPVNAILSEQLDWLSAIRCDALPRVGAEQGRQAVAIAQSILDSIETHCWAENAPSLTGPLATPTGDWGDDELPAILHKPRRQAAA